MSTPPTLLMGYGTLYLLLHAVAPYVLEDIFKAEEKSRFLTINILWTFFSFPDLPILMLPSSCS